MPRDRSKDIEFLDMPWPIAILAAGSPILLAVAIWICIRTFQFAFVVDPIMYPALQVYQTVIVDTRAYGPHRSPQYGDILAYNPPEAPGLTFFGRVAAKEGDTIRVSRSIVIVNGKPLSRTPEARRFGEWENQQKPVYVETAINNVQYLVLASDSVDGDIAELRVPKGAVFVLGDSRDGALDSRDIPDGFGPVSYDIIRGKVVWPASSSP